MQTDKQTANQNLGTASVASDSPNQSNETRAVFHGGYTKRKPLAVREDSLTIALHIPGKNTIRLTLASANALSNAIQSALSATSD